MDPLQIGSPWVEGLQRLAPLHVPPLGERQGWTEREIEREKGQGREVERKSKKGE